MLKIYDGRRGFYQWDLDQKLIVSDPAIKEVHFSNQTGERALVCEVYTEGDQRLVNVPNILLQDVWPIEAYAHNDAATTASQTFDIIARSRPADYAYTEVEVKTWDKLDNKIASMRTKYDREIDEISDKLTETESIAKGANQAVSFDDYETMIAALNNLPSDKYNCGQNVMIVTVKVPDLWVSAVAEESTEYTYTSDEDFVADLEENGSVQVGHYVLSQLETQKVNLTDYAKIGVFSYDDLADKPFEVLGSEILPAVDITMKKNYAWDLDPDVQVYYVSEQTFTFAELMDASNPFYMEIYSSSEGSILGTFKMTKVDSILEYDGCIEILKKIGTGSGTFGARVYVMNSSTPVEVGNWGAILTKKGIYFTGSPWCYGAEVSRLYRAENEVLNVKTLDNKYLDLANHPVIKDILSRL